MWSRNFLLTKLSSESLGVFFCSCTLQPFLGAELILLLQCHFQLFSCSAVQLSVPQTCKKINDYPSRARSAGSEWRRGSLDFSAGGASKNDEDLLSLLLQMF